MLNPARRTFILNTDFAFITDFCSKDSASIVWEMSEKLAEIQREIASLRKNLEELRRLQLDSDRAKKLRKKLVRIGCD
jgi:hypothetical protein